MPIQKNIPKLQTAQQNVPESLELRKEKYENAGYTYSFSPKEQAYIKYNTLRSKKKDTELLDVIKIYILKDEDEDKLYTVWFQNSKVKDFQGNLVRCPITECIGVCEDPQTEQVKDGDGNVTDINLIETHNYYYKEFNKSEIEELFKKSRNSQNIACYVGYVRNPKTATNDFINNKKLIRNQNAFMTKDFDELMNLPDGINKPQSYIRDGNKSKKQLKHTYVKKAMVNTNQPNDIEKRVKDNGQIWSETTEEITQKEQQTEQEESGEGQGQEGEEQGSTSSTTTTEESKTSTNNKQLKVGSGSNSSSSSPSSSSGSGSDSKKDYTF